jgi:hypothetical protein
MNRFLARYAAFCVLSLFLGINYDVGVILRPFDAFVAFGGMILVGRASVRGYIDRLKKPTVYYLFAATYFYRCANALFLSGMGAALKETLQIIEFLLLIHLIAVSTRSTKHRQVFFQTLFVGFGVMALATAAWHIGNGSYANYKGLGPLKFTFSFFGLLALRDYLREKPKRFAALVLLGAILLTVLSGERKSWVALAGAGGGMYVFFRGGNIWQVLLNLLRPRVLVGGGTVLIATAAIGLQFEYVFGQFENMRDVYLLLSNFDLQMDLSAFETSGSNLARLYALLFTIRTTMAHPWFGVGTGRWLDEIKAASNSNGDTYVLGSHSEYQRFAVENGLTGLFLYVVSWVVAFRQATRIYRRSVSPGVRSDALTVIGIIGFGALINFFLGGGALNTVYLALAIGLLVGFENGNESLTQ